ncbi:NAD(P)/FAD-dependent oxidoreductase [Chondrinema litorale]|uniref:NAD(P)/FAD-dependent oxidoreductase n=1 Tax=Chondrinema litorale TaxID=2994555 RepID=UPI002543E9E6|nr:FAD-dependent oxidoreductase [Chondrinema litorale]UZR93917.1 FAD-dependent oxidoreductase [Chondrinema litorale]
MKIDYLIVGQGIAGTILSYNLLKAGKTVRVIENDKRKSSSRVAAGIFNPITGRKMVKSWYADTLFPALQEFYPEFEAYTGENFFHQMDMFIPFDSQEKQNTWMANSAEDEYATYIRGFSKTLYKNELHADFGGMIIKGSGYVDIPLMLDSYRKKIANLGFYINDEFNYDDLKLIEDGVEWKGIEAEKIFFCDGVGSASGNPFFNWLAFRPVKGELLKVKFEKNIFEHAINRGCWILPQPDGTSKVGATYNNRELDYEVTEDARNMLLDKMEQLTHLPYQVVGQLTGIRPATYDRRPFVGLHPVYEQLGVFNGLGAKGISLAPYFAKHFTEVLLSGFPLMGLVDISRVIRKYNIKNDVLTKL